MKIQLFIGVPPILNASHYELQNNLVEQNPYTIKRATIASLLTVKNNPATYVLSQIDGNLFGRNKIGIKLSVNRMETYASRFKSGNICPDEILLIPKA